MKNIAPTGLAIVTVHLLLMIENKLLFSLRHNTGYADGLYSVVTGTLNGKESATEAISREAREEIGIEVPPSHLRFATTMHCLATDGQEYIELFFLATQWDGEICNLEPEKCKRLAFFPSHSPPRETIPYVKKGIENALHDIPYQEFGWEYREIPHISPLMIP